MNREAKRLITTKEFHALHPNIGSHRTIVRACAAGQIPSTKVGGVWIIDYDRWLSRFAHKVKRKVIFNGKNKKN